MHACADGSSLCWGLHTVQAAELTLARPLCCGSFRLSMPHAHTLRMTHIGLGGQQLDKVQVALEAASSRVHLLDLSSELRLLPASGIVPLGLRAF